MLVDTFHQKDVIKDRVLVFKSSTNSSINYSVTDRHEIYVIGNFRPFKTYISHLINTSNINLSVLIIFEGFKEFFLLTKFLNTFDKYKSEFEKKYLSDYSKLMKQSQEYPDVINENINLKLDKSQCNASFSFNFNVIINSSKFSDYNLSSDILVQQYVRFITMKHGGTVIATSELDLIISHPDYILNIEHEPQSTFSEDKIFNVKELSIALFIPRGLDSRNMIKILAKSIVPTDEKRLLLQDEDFDNFEQIYNSFLDAEDEKIEPPNPDCTFEVKRTIISRNKRKSMLWKDFLTKALEE